MLKNHHPGRSPVRIGIPNLVHHSAEKHGGIILGQVAGTSIYGFEQPTPAVQAALSGFSDLERPDRNVRGNECFLLIAASTSNKSWLDRALISNGRGYRAGNPARELLIDHALFKRLGDNHRKLFKPKDGGTGHIYAYNPLARRRILSNPEIDEVIEEVRRWHDVVQKSGKNNGRALPASAEELMDTFRAIGRFYVCVDSLIQQSPHIDQKAPRGYCKLLLDACHQISEMVQSIGNHLEQASQLVWKAPLVSAHLPKGLANARMWHSDGLADLETLKLRLGWYPAYGDLIQRIRALIEADESKRLTRFLILARSYRADLIRWLKVARASDDYSQLLQVLCRYIDLIVAEDLFAASSSPGSPRLLDILKEDRLSEPLFAAVSNLLDDDVEPTDYAIGSSLCENYGVGAEPRQALPSEYMGMIRRALLLGHRNAERQVAAAQAALVNELWMLLAYNRTPLRALELVAGKIHQLRDPDLHKIFYDSIEPRLLKELERTEPVAARQTRSIEAVERLIARFFGLEIFLERRYFQNFQHLVTTFIAKAQLLGINTDKPSDALARLRAEYEQKPRGTTEPEGLGDLPGPLLAELAERGLYPKYFASAPSATELPEARRPKSPGHGSQPSTGLNRSFTSGELWSIYHNPASSTDAKRLAETGLRNRGELKG